jgi:thymidylate synthase
MKQYHDLLQDILLNGEQRGDRTGVGTISVFGRQLRFDLTKGFPAVTTKKLAWKAVVSELLWFLEGSGDERRLAEILYGRPDSERNTIWTGNAQAEYWTPKAKFPGDLGRVYGVQWRRWRQPLDLVAEDLVHQDEAGDWISGPLPAPKEIDQIKNLIDGIKNDPNGRRHIISAWNVGELDQMALPPCHVLAQFYVSKGKLSCHMYQRSVDVFLGLPFNIASYALLTHLIARVCDLDVGELIISTGDTHIYSNHVEQVKQQLNREPMKLPTLWLNPNIKNIEDFSPETIELDNYFSHATIKADMAV